MSEENKNKFASIFAAAQAKADEQSKPNFKAIPAPTRPQAAKLPVNKDPNNVRTFDNIKDITDAAQNGEIISIFNLSNIINGKQTTPTPPPAKPEVKDIFPEIAAEVSKMQSFTITAHEGEQLNLKGKIFTTWETANNALKLICDQYTGPGYYKTYILIEWENGRNLSDRIDIQDKTGDFWAYNENIGQYLANHYKSLTGTLSFKDEPTDSNTPELSNFTFEDICNEPAQETQQAPTQTATLTPCVMQWTKAEQAATAPKIAPVTPVKDEEFKPLPPVKVGPFTFIHYSPKSFAIVAVEETKAIKDKLYFYGASYNARLKFGKGFIFSIKKYNTVKTFIESIAASL